MSDVRHMPTERQMTLELMLAELESSRLEVVLAPAPLALHAGHCVRVVAGRNARWYRDFCAQFPSSRRRRNTRPDTCIRRRETVRALRRMIAGETGGQIYGARLLEAARAYYRRHRDVVKLHLQHAAA